MPVLSWRYSPWDGHLPIITGCFYTLERTLTHIHIHTFTQRSTARTPIFPPAATIVLSLHASLIGNKSWVSGLQTRQCVIPSTPASPPLLLGTQRSDSPSDKTGVPYEQQAGAESYCWWEMYGNPLKLTV